MLNDTEWKGYYAAVTENHTKSGNIWNYSELQDDHQVNESGIKITPGCNTYIIIQSYNLKAITPVCNCHAGQNLTETVISVRVSCNHFEFRVDQQTKGLFIVTIVSIYPRS